MPNNREILDSGVIWRLEIPILGHDARGVAPVITLYRDAFGG